MSFIKKNILIILLLFVGVLQSQTYISEDFDTDLGSFTTMDEGSATGDTWSSGNVESQNLNGTNAAFVSNNYVEEEIIIEGPFRSVAAKVAAETFKETLLSPVFDASAATKLILQFDEAFNSSDNSNIAIVQVFDGTQWVTVHTHSGSASFSNPDLVELDISSYKNPSMQVQFVFDDLGVEGNYWMIDELSVTNTSCSDPSNIIVSEIEDTSATVNFTAGYSETAWEIIIQESSLDEPVIAGESLSQNSYSAAGLLENTSYKAYVRASCGNSDYSNWVVSSKFTTSYTCPKPDNIKSSNSTPTTIEISWTVNGDETEWEIEYGPQGFINDTGVGTIVTGITTNPYTVTGLDFDTNYDFYVRAVCGESSKSLWEGVTERETLKECEEPTNFKATSWSTSSVDLEWSQGYQELSWELEYGEKGFTQGNGTFVEVTQTTHQITGLSIGTSYDVYVRSQCSESSESIWVQLTSFSTLCATVSEMILEDFESYNSKFILEDEDCLLQQAETTAVWYIASGSTSSNGTGPESGSGGDGYYAFLEANNNTGTDHGSTADLHLNFPIDLSVFTTPKIDFDYHMVGSEMGTLQLYMIDESGTSILLKEFVDEQQDDTSDDFLTTSVDLDAYGNQTVRFFFRAVRGATYAGDMAIDNIKVYDDTALSTAEVFKDELKVTVYPNPTTAQLFIEMDSIDISYQILDMSGIAVKQGVLSSKTSQLNLESLVSGIYILKIDEKVIRVIKE